MPWFFFGMVWLYACAAPRTSGPGGAAAPVANTANVPAESSMGAADDICGFTEAVTLGPVASDGFVDVPANHPDIFYMGRIDCSDPLAPSFAYPGVSIRVRFQGNALDMQLEDFGNGSASGTNYYSVSIDGGAPRAFSVNAGRHVYPLGRELGDSVHEAELVKRGESNHGSGKARFLGFRIRQGNNLLPVSGRARRLEFIGDSITCGYGNELSTNDPSNDHYTTKNSNADQAYGARVARALGAEYVAVAASGRGISRNYGGEPGTLVPELHRLVKPDEPTPWDYTRYQPDVTVVNLGTNDYSTPGVDRNEFRARYSQFLRDLRQHYPRTLLIVAAGPMLSDDYPPGEQVWSKFREDLKAVVQALSEAGENALHYVEFEPQSPPFGEDWHPTLATHERMANVLTAKIKELKSW